MSIEILLLDLRYFLDESLSFIEFFEYGERDLTRRFQASNQEVTNLRQFAIEYTRLIYDLKKLLTAGHSAYAEFNPGFEFSEQFRNKRLFYYTRFFRRLEALDERVQGETALSNDMVKIYFRTVQNLVRGTNELIGYLEAARWSRDVALEILDRLVQLCNDFLCVFEKFVSRLEANKSVWRERKKNFDSSSGSEADFDNEGEATVSGKRLAFLKGISWQSSVLGFGLAVCFIWYLSRRLSVAVSREQRWYVGSVRRGMGYVSSMGFVPGLLTAQGWGRWTGEAWLTANQVKVEVNSLQMWNEVFCYMTEVYIVAVSVGAFVLLEWMSWV